MILYFINRNVEVLGIASTNLSNGYEIIDDELTEDIDSGVASLHAVISWSDATRLQLEEWTSAGNYVLVEHDNEALMLTIITNETDTAQRAVTIYAEDAGLDLLNEIAPAYVADATHNIEWYINHFLGDSDFEIGTNEIPSLTRKLSWDGESTVTERIRSIATQFDNAEISYSFVVENLVVTHKYINIWVKRGTDADQELRLDRDINSIKVITSLEELFTGLVVTGGTPEGADVPIDLKGYSYDDGDFYVDSAGRLLSRSGAEKWGRLTNTNSNSYIMGTFTFDTTTKSELCNRAITYLKAHIEPAVNYEVDIERGLGQSHIGDRVNIVDDKGGIYVSARILMLKTSATQNKKTATLGEYLIKSSGISDKVVELANQFQQLASSREFMYSLSVSSSAGSYFINSKVETTLVASILYGGVQATGISNAEIQWYSGNTLLGTGTTYNVSNQTTISITCKLVRDGNILAEDYITLFSLEMIYQTADSALSKSNASISEDTLHYLATSQGSGVTTDTAGWTTTPQSITPTDKYLWTYHTYTKANGTSVDTVPVITGTYGEDGTSVTILGSYNTLAELQQAHPTGDRGDAYLVAGDLYVWNGSAWEDVGQIQGPQGEIGVGVKKVQPQYYLSTSATSATGGSWSTTLTYTVGKYIWTRDKITYTNNSTNYSTAIYNSALTTACANSETALQVSRDTEQHFWTTETGTDTGAHITESTQTDFVADPQNGGANLIARSNGVAIRDGLTELASFSADGIAFDDGTPFVIGNSNTYIVFQPANNRIVLGGSNISLNGQKTLGETLSELDQAQSTATSAQTTATNAQTTANTARTTANNASTTANTAIATANSANATANDASETANDASATASTAQTTAENAQTTANTATTKANNAQTTANTAVTKADNAQTTANQAKSVADNTAQYFWFTSSGTDTGAHITEVTQSQFVANPSGGNLLAKSNGISVRDGLTELAKFTGNGLEIFTNGISRASLGDVVRIGRTAPPHIEMESSATRDGDDGYSVSTIAVKKGVRECGVFRLTANTYTSVTPQVLEVEMDDNKILAVYAHTNELTSRVHIGDPTSSSRFVDVNINGDLEISGNITTDGAQINDFVTEQGTSGIWTYRIWKSGMMEMWGKYTANIAITTSSASYGGYRSGQLNIPTFPVTFGSKPTITATASSAGGFWVNNVVPTTTGGTFYLSCGASLASASRSVSFHVIGI